MSQKPRFAGLIALTLFVALPLGLAAVTAANILRQTEAQTLIDGQAQVLAGLDARIARLGATAGQPADLSSIYVAAEAAPLAAARLQQILEELVIAANGKIVETQVVDQTEAHTPDEVSVRLVLDVDNAGLRTFLHDAEAGLPLLFVDRLDVRQLAASGADAPDNPILRVEATLRAAWRKP